MFNMHGVHKIIFPRSMMPVSTVDGAFYAVLNLVIYLNDDQGIERSLKALRMHSFEIHTGGDDIVIISLKRQ
jgi:hypothetical protein